MHIIGHFKERKALSQSLDGKLFSQAFLFFGPRSVGKSLCALELAALLALEPDFVPTTGKPHPFDVMVIYPMAVTKKGITKMKKIPAEDIRAALNFLGSFPASGGFRTVVIEDAHRLSETAQNVLLKTLEEPNPSTVIILVTHELGSILPTLLSRVKRVRFDFVPEEAIRRGLAEYFPQYPTGEVAPFFFALGRPGMILSALVDASQFSTEREKLGTLFRLSTLSLSERLKLAEKLSTNADLTVRLLEWWLPGLYNQAKKIKERQLTVRFYALLEAVEQTIILLKTTQSNTRLLLEKLFLSL